MYLDHSHRKQSSILQIIILLLLPVMGITQDSSNRYGLKLLNTAETLLQTISMDSNKAFVHIRDYVPEVILDIKYASKANVFYEQLYPKPYALIRLPVAKALRGVQEDLRPLGIGLKIYDAYRPYSVTCRMWELLPDSNYMGLPWKGSKHNRGIAVDLTLADLRTGKELAMPTPYDALVYAAHPSFMGLPDSVIRNRTLLITTMKKWGFTVDTMEWWHFNYSAGNEYELLNIDHEDLLSLIRKQRKKK